MAALAYDVNGTPFGISVITIDGFDVATTTARLAREIENVRAEIVEVLVQECADQALRHNTELTPDSGLFFWLCRHLVVHFAKGERADLGRVLAPLGLVYIELLDFYEHTKGTSLHMREEALLWFEEAWGDVNYGAGEGLLKEAYEISKNDGPMLDPPLFGHFVRFAWHLQLKNGDKPIFLPVNDQLADLFEVSHVTISKYVKIAARRGYLLKQSEAVKMKKARTWKFNFGHLDFVRYHSGP